MSSRTRTRRPASPAAPEEPGVVLSEEQLVDPTAALATAEQTLAWVAAQPVEPEVTPAVLDAIGVCAEPDPVTASCLRRQAARYAAKAKTAAGPRAVAGYVVGPRGLKIGGEQRPPGADVPEALGWPRVETWVATGRIIPVYA